MRTATSYRVTAGKASIESSDETSAFQVAAKLTDCRCPNYSGSNTAQVDIVHSDGVRWSVRTANYGQSPKFSEPTLKKPAQQNPSFATQVAGDGTESGRSATDQGSVNCVAKPERTTTPMPPSSFDVPPGWVKIEPARMEQLGQPGPTVVFLPVHQIIEFASNYTGVTTIKTARETYITKTSLAEFAQQVSTAQGALFSGLRGAFEGLGVKER